MGQARNWTNDEIAFLEEKWGVKSIGAIAKALNRSITGVKIKAGRLGLGAFLESSDLISLNTIIREFKSNYSWTRGVWERNGCPIRTKKVNQCSFAVVDIDEFWEWAEQHKELFDFNKLEKNIFGIEPSWVSLARKASFENKPYSVRKQWTKDEDGILERMVKSGKPINEISQMLRRTEGAVRRRCFDIQLKQRPRKNKPSPWNDEEIKMLLKLRAAGNTWEIIGAKIGRSASSCRGKFECLLNPQKLKRSNRKNRAALKSCFQKTQCAHYRNAIGCEIGGTNCDDCSCFVRLKLGEKADTGWNKTNRCSDARELLEKINGDSPEKR